MATDLARKMVCDWGMSEKLGPLHFGKREGEVFLGRDFGDAGKDYSEQTAIEIDSEVRNIVTANYDRARKTVVDNLDKLKVLAEALLEYETVDGAEIDTIFSGGRLNRTVDVTRATAGQSAVAARAAAAAEKPARPSIFAPPRPRPTKRSALGSRRRLVAESVGLCAV